MRLNQSIVSHGTVVTFNTFMRDIVQTTEVFAKPDNLTHTTPHRQANRVDVHRHGPNPVAGSQQETIETLKAELTQTKESLATMQKVKRRVVHYSKLQCEVMKAVETTG